MWRKALNHPSVAARHLPSRGGYEDAIAYYSQLKISPVFSIVNTVMKIIVPELRGNKRKG
jgi:hypothetical protein